jgi:5-methylcytosine-specific restriction endonuclease McrA
VNTKQRRILAIVATDSTFEPSRHGNQAVWVGRCIHCKSHLTIAANGQPISEATIEHIWPQHHGGDYALSNIALACGPCNRSKAKHDRRHKNDPKLAEIVAELRRRRTVRWRESPPQLASFVEWALKAES